MKLISKIGMNAEEYSSRKHNLVTTTIIYNIYKTTVKNKRKSENDTNNVEKNYIL